MKGIYRRKESIAFVTKMSPFSIKLNNKLFAFLIETFSLIVIGGFHCYKNKAQIQSSSLIKLSRTLMAMLRKKRKLAAVSRETPEFTRSSRVQNTLDPESTQDYISQVSEEIEGRVTKKLSKEFSWTESCILVAFSKFDEFLLNPQVRTCSVAVPGTSRNNNSEKRETTGDRSSDNPCPEVRYSSRHFGQKNSPEPGDGPHMVTGVTKQICQYPHMTTAVQEEIPYCSPGIRQEKKRRRAPQVSHNSAVRTTLRQLKQTKFCWHFNNWRRTVIQPISTTTSVESRNCPNLLRRQCPRSMENQRNSNCLKNCS